MLPMDLHSSGESETSPVTVSRRSGIYGAAAAVLLLLGAWASSPAVVQGQTVDLQPVADATIYEPTQECSNPSVSLNANGGGPGLFIGRTGPIAGNLVRRSLIRFDVAAAIPAGATIESAALSLTVDRSNNSAGFTTELRALEASWNEGPTVVPSPGGGGDPSMTGDVTWCDRELGSAEWSNDGGDFGTAVVGSVLMNGVGTYVIPSSPDMVAAVQSWLDDPMANDGWMVRGDEGFSSGGIYSARRLASREADEDQPVLTVTYSAPEIPPTEVPIGRTGALLLAVALALCAARWLRTG